MNRETGSLHSNTIDNGYTSVSHCLCSMTSSHIKHFCIPLTKIVWNTYFNNIYDKTHILRQPFLIASG